MNALDCPRRTALAPYAWRPDPRLGSRIRHLVFGSALSTLFVLWQAALPGPAAAGGDGATANPGLSSASARSGRVPRLLGRSRSRPAAGTAKATPSGPTVSDCPTCAPLRSFRPKHFKNSTEIDNPWMPLEPGTRLVHQGRSNADGELLDHTVTLTVTDLVKVVGGVRCVVVWIEDVEEGALAESKLEFFAQSDRGDVWHAGEYAENYEQGLFTDADGSWIHGIEDAQAGILVEDDPEMRRSRVVASSPAIDLLDCGSVVSIQKSKPKFCVPGGCFRSVLTFREWAPLDACPEIVHRVFAKGVGIIQAGPIDTQEGETLVLVESGELDDKEMRAARDAALALDRHGAEVNEPYAQTRPAQPARSREARGHRATADMEIAAAPARTFLRVGTNPFAFATTLTYAVAEPGPVELGIYDVLGRRVRTIVHRNEASGIHEARWDGRNDAGGEVARGVYFARLRVGAQVLNKTLVRVRQ